MTQLNRSAPAAALRHFVIAVAPVVMASLLGSLATFPNLAPWYASLTKPVFNPPNWLFGPVWTALYALMAFACWRILRIAGDLPARRTALGIYAAQLLFNAAWSWLFFALHSPLGGLLNIVPQWLLILATIYWFARLDRIAAFCLLPLAAWVGFAALLNFAIWRLNG